MIYFIFCARYEAENADNARMSWIWFDVKFMKQTIFPFSEGDSSACN